MQPPAQELVARDLHDYAWTFKHIYRGNVPKQMSSHPFSFCSLCSL